MQGVVEFEGSTVVGRPSCGGGVAAGRERRPQKLLRIGVRAFTLLWVLGLVGAVDARSAAAAAPVISDVSPDRYFSPDGDGQEDVAAVSFTLSERSRVSIVIREADTDTIVRHIETDVPREGASSFTWDGRADGVTAVVSDGVYRYGITAESFTGEVVSVSGRVGVDTRAVAVFSRPAADEVVSGQAQVTVTPGTAGRVLDDNGYVYLCSYDGQCGQQFVGYLGVADFDGSRSVTWDTAGASTGDQYLWGYVPYTDAFGQTHSYTLPRRHVVVSRAVQITQVSADRYFSPDGDGLEDDGGPLFCINAPADVELTIRDGDGQTARSIAAAARPQGCQAIVWDGRRDDGSDAPDGGYAYTLRAQGADGGPSTVAGRIGIRRGPAGRVLRPVADDVLSRSARFEFEPQDDVTTTSVRPCVGGACITITAANASGLWASSMDLSSAANGQTTLVAAVRWRDPYGSAHETPLSVPVTVDTASPEVELSVTPSTGEAPLAATVRVAAQISTGRALSYTIDFGDGTPNATGTIADPYAPIELVHEFAAEGSHRVRVDVNDGVGNGARRSAVVNALPPKNHAPTAMLSLSTDDGAAPLDVEAAVSGSDEDGDPLTYALDWGDGNRDSGNLPHGAVAHRYARPGTFLVRLSVSDGTAERVQTRRVVAVSSEPLLAAAGDDLVVTSGEPALLDGGQSRPAELIDAYSWDFGDGATGSGLSVDHVYASPGEYTARLTVASGSERRSDDVKVTVLAPSPSAGLAIHVRSGGAPVAAADVLVIDSDGRRLAATTDSGGDASIDGVPDGEHTVYAWRDGYRPTSVATAVTDGRGEATVELQPGDVVSTEVTSDRLDAQEIEDLGIDPDDPGNQHMYQFEVHLAFEADPEPFIQLRGYVREGEGGGGEPFRWEYQNPGGGWATCSDRCPYNGGFTYPVVHYSDDIPTLQWLIIPGRASFLKEFFSVTMTVQNLAGPGVTLKNGAASLELPAGLSLAPTAQEQSLDQPVGDIAGGASASAAWIIRGDAEGEYSPSASYSGTLEPFGRSVSYRAALRDPLRVWGGSALQMVVQPESRVERNRPYRVRIGLRNVADVPVYNPTVELLREGRLNYIEQPRERMRQGAAAVQPGATFWTDDYVLVPKITGRLVPRYSFVKKTAGDVDLQDSIEPVAQKPVSGIETRPSKDSVIVDFQAVAGAERYEIYSTDTSLDVDFPDEPLSDIRWLDATKAMVRGVDPSADAKLYAVSTVKDGVNTMYHPAVSMASSATWPSPTTEVDYDLDCDSATTTLRFTFSDEDFPLRDYHLKLGDGAAIDATIPAAGYVERANVAIPAGGLKVEAWATNDEQAGTTEHGPAYEQTIRRCRYAAIGDSFSSGEAAEEYEAGTASDFPGHPGAPLNTCHRSSAAYPRLVDRDEIAPNHSANWGDMTFRACSGAVIADLSANNQGGYTFNGGNEGPQLKHIDSGVQILTISIGGNDAYFSDIVKNCLTHGLDEIGLLKPGAINENTDPQQIAQLLTPCRPAWDAKVARKLIELRTQLPQVYSSIRNRIAANARVLVVPYPEFFPRRQTSCWGISEADVNWLNSGIYAANEVIRQAAAAAGVEYVDLGGRFDDHDSCQVFGRWVNGFAPFVRNDGGVGITHSFHPNKQGHEALAEAVKAQIRSGPVGDVGRINQGETQRRTVRVSADSAEAVFTTEWEGSDIPMTLVAPSGRRIERGDESHDVTHFGGPTHDAFTVTRPEPGDWTVEIHGLDVPATGEEVRFRFTQTAETNQAPSPLFSVSHESGPPPELEVRFDASASFDIDGEVREYRWDFGDGGQATGQTVTHTFAGPASHRPRLTVVDNEGKESSYDGQLIRVTRPPRAQDDAYTVEAGETLTVAAPGVLDNDEDEDGDDLHVSVVGQPEHGTVTLASDGRLVYVPQAGFVGVERLTYLAVDEHDAPAELAEIAITVRDTIAPTVTVAQPSALTTDGTPTVAGTAGDAVRDDPEVTVKLYAGTAPSGSPLHTLTARRSGTGWTVDAPALADGTFTAVAIQPDAAGNTSANATRTFTVDTADPAVSIATPGVATNDPTPAVSGIAGTASTGSGPVSRDVGPVTITVTRGETRVDRFTAAVDPATGAYSKALPAGLSVEGRYTVTVDQLDEAGNAGSASKTFRFDQTVPVPQLTAPEDGAYTRSRRPAIAGTAGRGEGDGGEVRVTLNRGATELTSFAVEVDAGGGWSGQPADDVPDGDYTITATQVDDAGNSGTSAARVLHVDGAPPAPTLDQPAAGAATNDATPAITGAAGTAAGDNAPVTVEIYLGSSATGAPLSTLNATRSGAAWSATPAADLADGTYTIRATQDDRAGNTGHSPAHTFKLDTVRPLVTLTAPAATTNDTTPDVAGSAGTQAADASHSADASDVRVVVSGGQTAVTPFAAAVGAGGTFSAAVPEALAEGVYTVSVTQEDAAGNTSSVATREVRIDITKPAVDVTSPPPIGNDATPTLAGTAGDATGDGSSVKVVLHEGGAGGPQVGSALAAARTGRAWSADAPALPDGSYTAVATQEDEAGNTSAAASRSFTVDTTGPSLSVTPPSATNDSTPTIAGRAGTASFGAPASTDVPTVTVTVKRGTATVSQFSAAVDPATGNWSEEVPAADALTVEDTYTVDVSQSDDAANTGTASGRLRFDTTAPAPGVTAPADGAYTKVERPGFVGEAGTATGDDASVRVILSSAAAEVARFDVAVGAGGAWSGQPDTDLAEGDYAVTVTQGDDAGNSRTSAGRTLHVDRTPPAVTMTAPASPTNDATPTLTGAAGTAAGDHASVKVLLTGPGGETSTVDATLHDATWTATPPADLADGLWNATAVQEDEAGNSASAALERSFTVDTAAPDVALVAPADGAQTEDATPQVSGTAGTGDRDRTEISVKLYAGASVAGPPVRSQTAIASAGGWVVELSPELPLGQYTVQAEQEDSAGNLGKSAPRRLEIVAATTTPTPAPTPAPGPGQTPPAPPLLPAPPPIAPQSQRDTTPPRISAVRLPRGRLLSIAVLRRAKLRIGLKVDEPSTVVGEALLDLKTAKRLGITGKRLELGAAQFVRVGGSRSMTLDSGGSLVIAISQRTRARLVRGGPIRLLLRLTAVDGSRNATVAKRTLTVPPIARR